MEFLLKKINIELPQIANSDSVLITDVIPAKKWENGVATDITFAYKYKAICPRNGFISFNIKIEGKALLTQKEIDDNGGSIEIRPKNFHGKFFVSKNKDVIFVATATGLEVV